MMKFKVSAGILLCLAGIALINQNRWRAGLVSFVIGFLLMMYPRR